MSNPIQIKADPEFVKLLRKMKTETIAKNGIKLSDPTLTKIISRKIKDYPFDVNVGKWKIKLL